MGIQVGGKLFSYNRTLKLPDEDGTIATREWVAANGGGDSPFRVATVTLNNTQIRALPTTGVELIPAQGPNTVVQPVVIFGVMDTTGGAYTNTADASFVLMQGPDWISSTSNVVSILTEVGDRRPFWMVMPRATVGAAPFTGEVVAPVGLELLSNRINAPTKIKDDYSGGSNYTGGHASNTFRITIYYIVFDV